LASLRHDDPAETLRRLTNGYQSSQAVHVAATLGIADLLADGPRASDELASATGSHPDALYRLLRALASVGVLQEESGRTFSLTEVGDCLRRDSPESLAGWATFVGRPYYWNAWAHLLDSVRTGENAFQSVYGTTVWEYRAEHPEESAIFDGAMTALTRRVNKSLLESYDFARFATVVDVGGGHGVLLAAVLAEHPAMQGVLFDQPHVVALAHDLLQAAGVADRCRVVGGSFFESVPEGADAYLLKAILHDWEDAEAATILQACRGAMPADGTLVVVERILAPPNEGAAAKFSDLNMLVGPGGRERTIDDFEALFVIAGFQLQGETPAASGLSVITATLS
jgi:O-methyltransferase/methyltransferase family protein